MALGAENNGTGPDNLGAGHERGVIPPVMHTVRHPLWHFWTFMR